MALIFQPGTGQMDDEALKEYLTESVEKERARLKTRALTKKQLISPAAKEDAESPGSRRKSNPRFQERSPPPPFSADASSGCQGGRRFFDWHAVFRAAARHIRKELGRTDRAKG
ncbi:hypothetical protein SEPCBS119000_005279 [Sporothrix epigloea]|uniref:Uncharacterized protein n=1 Tax=Sporothrix epigloea TaxID=1892477 RepID=A0ABP0DWY3_9PEZI